MNSVSLCARASHLGARASHLRAHAAPRLRHAAAISILGVLAACGGGGGGGDANPADVRIAQENCSFGYAAQAPQGGTGDDPLLPNQWHLRNRGQAGGSVGEDVRAIDAWSASGKGEGVRLAVVDDAIETLHEDLFPNVAAFRNYRTGAPPDTHPLPCESADTHGTAVAGIAAARDGNGRGVAGVAPRVSLAAYNALTTSQEADVADALRRDGDVTGVYNNSWGSPDRRGTLSASGTTFRNAILDGVAHGRGGLGAVYVFPAGNGGCPSGTSCSPDDSNYDGYVNGLGILAACAVDDEGHGPVYAEPGANILVCGMSDGGTAGSPGITTTDVRNGYRSDFSGTSASTPMVSGVAALVLQANPSLTWRDVRLILASTARKNDPGSSGWQTNQAGLRVHPLYGFGVVDAEAATARARSWSSVGRSDSLRSCPYTRSPDKPLRDATTISDTIAVGADCPISRIEFVEIGFSATHSYSGDLQIELQRPGISPPARLADTRVCRDSLGASISCGAYDGWVFGSVRNLDEAAQGEWTLAVSDNAPADEGRWTAWSLTIWGR
ncbi:MAG TPA: S8 family serine peptidase [Zeimonas sp.]